MVTVRIVAIVCLLVILVLGAFSSSPLVIVSDTNRDGKVSFVDDPGGKSGWTNQRGAVFMCNNDSDQNSGKPDHADKVINGDNDLPDLALIMIKQIPGLKKGSKLYISISEPACQYVHLFYKSGSDYIFIENNEKQELPGHLLGDANVELRIEANSYAHPGWDGCVTVTAALETPGKTHKDSIQLKVAPFIMLSAVQKAQRMYVREFPAKNEAFIKDLKELTSKIGVQLKIIPAGTYKPWNIWLQDVMEVGYSKTPFKWHHVVLKANRGKSLDDMPQQMILGPDHGWLRVGEFKPETGKGRGGDSWLDWYGNLEVTPPLPGKPFGRIFYGYNKYTGRSLNPQIVEVLAAQGVQAPLIKIHTGWLLIKHVDEIFNFVRVKGGKGFKLLVTDVTVTYRLLDQWNKEGKGNLPVLRDLRENKTVVSLLNDRELWEYNLELQKKEIEVSIETMKRAIGLDEGDIIRIPSLFEKVYGYAGALIPNMVNSVHMNGHQIIADPKGPVDKASGKDLLQEYVRGLLAKENIVVYFIDDKPYHIWHGEVHCATNVTYQPYDTPWWK
ncbi:MAG: hypothetical protein GTN53_18040 [Candidatus Aminicenantes bacterium]|nr:hypothetical protein [Candidatus Aminicenantes bacterium]NIQ68355.1 hypothetical protein [Candidatus Aminicenantes bacterium]NIT24398.1 hypothetical protein [Candidatus Aminicenantes bacterium]